MFMADVFDDAPQVVYLRHIMKKIVNTKRQL